MNDLKEWLEKKYWEEGLSQDEIAVLINRSPSSVRNLMKKFNIKTRGPGMSGRDHSEKAKQRMREVKGGDKNPRWKGGDEHYWGKIARNAWEEHWREKVPAGYIVHHSDENIKNNNICNLALLTVSFHMKLHRRKK
ncbi:MAG: HNH endonuclease [candidate division Zixibacteria bacterium]|nr:HNH endonuclease [candidate division Zixibacteria bacterium]